MLAALGPKMLAEPDKEKERVDVVDDWIHETADGRKLWVIHGDLFDGVIQCAKYSSASTARMTPSSSSMPAKSHRKVQRLLPRRHQGHHPRGSKSM